MVLICKWSLALKVGLCVLYLPSWNHYCEIFHTRFQDQRAKCDNPKVWSSVKEVVNQFDVVTSLICPNGMSYSSGMWRRNQQTLATRQFCFFYDGSWRITSIIMFTSEEKKKKLNDGVVKDHLLLSLWLRLLFFLLFIKHQSYCTFTGYILSKLVILSKPI